MNEEQCMQKVIEIIDGNDRGAFADSTHPDSNFDYSHLLAVLQMGNKLDGGMELFLSLYDYAIKCGKAAIAKKSASGEKIKVYFLSYSAAEFPAEGVYTMLKADEHFETKIILVPLTDRNREDALHSYEESRKSFAKKGYDFVSTWNPNNDALTPWSAMGGYPDIMIHTSSWNQCIAEPYQITYCPFTTLNAYIPYGISSVNSADGTFANAAHYQNPNIILMWNYYVALEAERQEYVRYSILKGQNVETAGYPKMDTMMDPPAFTDEDIRSLWKIPAGKSVSEVKRIIYSPHYTIMYHDNVCLSTFHENGYFMLYLAEQYKDTISFIYKPHPNLRMSAIRMGYMKDAAAYEDYIARWNALPNARVVEEDDYLPYFITSDGIINDSASFLMEYQYTHKPMLYLRKETQRFREFTNALLPCLYQVPGTDYAGIQRFLDEVILQGQDTKKKQREQYFNHHLNYMKKGGSAAEHIYRSLCRLLEET